MYACAQKHAQNTRRSYFLFRWGGQGGSTPPCLSSRKTALTIARAFQFGSLAPSSIRAKKVF